MICYHVSITVADVTIVPILSIAAYSSTIGLTRLRISTWLQVIPTWVDRLGVSPWKKQICRSHDGDKYVNRNVCMYIY